MRLLENLLGWGSILNVKIYLGMRQVLTITIFGMAALAECHQMNECRPEV